MKLTREQIKSALCGVSYTVENGGLELHRMTKQQEKAFEESQMPRAGAGTRMSFRTDATKIRVKFEVAAVGSSRKFASCDILVNGGLVWQIKNFADNELKYNNLAVERPLGVMEGEAALGVGEKHVEVLFPWPVSCKLHEVELTGGELFEPVKREKILFCLGDSISQGYDAKFLINRYADNLARALGAEEYNFAVGGDRFRPALAEAKAAADPDYITVGYGTNDWSRMALADVEKRCVAFYKNLSKNFPRAKIFAITPIWRDDYEKETPFGDFLGVAKIIENACKGLANVTVICGWDLVPHDKVLYSDLYVHPSDEGFHYYAKNLTARILQELTE
jgi:hypothetical protein